MWLQIPTVKILSCMLGQLAIHVTVHSLQTPAMFQGL